MQYQSYNVSLEKYNSDEGCWDLCLYDHASDILIKGEEIKIVIPGVDIFTINGKKCRNIKIEVEK